MIVLHVASEKITVKSMRVIFIAILAVTGLSLAGCESFPESTFNLAHESRLPRWFTLPPEVSRSEITVTMSYYVKPSGRTTVFKLMDSKKRVLSKVTGTQIGLEALQLKTQRPGFPPGYPLYELVTVNGITEIIEHRQMEPVFYITDDPQVKAELLSSDKGSVQPHNKK